MFHWTASNRVIVAFVYTAIAAEQFQLVDPSAMLVLELCLENPLPGQFRTAQQLGQERVACRQMIEIGTQGD